MTDRKPTYIIVIAAAGDVNDARKAMTEALRLACPGFRYSAEPWFGSYEVVRHNDGTVSDRRVSIDMTDDEYQRFLRVADGAAATHGFDTAPIDVYRD